MISALAWVPRGAVARVPKRQELSKEEIEAIKAAAEEEAGHNATDSDGDEMEDTDAEAAADGSAPKSNSKADAEDEELGADIPAGLGEDDDEEDADPDETDDLHAKYSDAFVIVANTEDEYSSLEVHCYNESDGSLYVHHDVTLPSYPLALAWSDYAGDAAGQLYIQTGDWKGNASNYVGNYCAVGTFDPDIEIWNMDVLDPLEPTLVLKGVPKPAKSSKKASKASGSKASASSAAGAAGNADGHSDAVMGLAWNRTHRHMLCSSSADSTFKVWDIDGGGKVLHTYRHHKSKVASVQWNPVETSVLAAASYDRTVSVTDARESSSARIARYALTADPEALLWNHHMPASFLVATEDGLVTCYDVRSPDKPLWALKAHDQAVTSIALSPTADGLMATSSLDKSVKLWDCSKLSSTSAGASASAASAQALISKKAMSIGQVFTCSFFPNNPFLLACGGSKGMLAIWDASEDAGELNTKSASLSESATAASAAAGVNPIVGHFAGRMKEPSAVPGLAIRQRADGQPLAP